MNRTAKTVRLLQAVAAIMALAIIYWSLGLPNFRFAEAANLTDVSNTLSNSAPSEASNHSLQFSIPAGSSGIDASSEAITITFPAGFDLATDGVDFDDIDLEVASVDQTIVDGGTEAANQWGVNISGQDLIITSGGGTATATAADTLLIQVGNNAAAGDSQVVNPAATGSHEFLIALPDDSGATVVAIVDSVQVTASVDTLFTFEVAGVAGGEAVNGTTTTGEATATTIPFGTLTAGHSTTTAQDLTVTTNAAQGYTVSVVADGQLRSSTGADIDGFVEGAYATDPTAWSAPSGSVGSENTYGHWGLTSDDSDTTARAGEEFGANEWASASTSPVIVMGHDGPADGVSAGVGTTRIGYQVEITALQEAADDYSAILTYIATPTF